MFYPLEGFSPLDNSAPVSRDQEPPLETPVVASAPLVGYEREVFRLVDLKVMSEEERRTKEATDLYYEVAIGDISERCEFNGRN